MANYVISGPSAADQLRSRYLYPLPYNWHVAADVPVPDREYTVILCCNWHNNTLYHTPSIATLLLRARLVETDQLWPLREIYVDQNVLFCEHLTQVAQVSIMRSENGYLFLCQHCIVSYALSGVPELPEMVYDTFYHHFSKDFPTLFFLGDS